MATETSFKCWFCPVCDGLKCIGQMPGMGGIDNNRNFILNCSGWAKIREDAKKEGSPLVLPPLPTDRVIIRLGPVTGAVENIGFTDEQEFYYNYIFSGYKAHVGLSIGDGYPDIKLQSGIGAVRLLQKTDATARAAVFIKPYSNEKILERMEWASDVAEIIGIDIDSYNIVTMRNLAHLEKKSGDQLTYLKNKAKFPFAIKGIFTEENIDIIKKVKPDIAIVSNHGGRIKTRTGSTAEFLAEYAKVLADNCSEIWVDGGLRSSEDIRTALALGAKEVMIARPFIAALCQNGTDGLIRKAEEFRSKKD